jgi:hypothetical protein
MLSHEAQDVTGLARQALREVSWSGARLVAVHNAGQPATRSGGHEGYCATLNNTKFILE